MNWSPTHSGFIDLNLFRQKLLIVAINKISLLLIKKKKASHCWLLTQSSFIVAVIIDVNPLNHLSSLQLETTITCYTFCTLVD
jgi:hypothetical protein